MGFKNILKEGGMYRNIGIVVLLRAVGRSLFVRRGTPVRLSVVRLFSTFVLLPLCLCLTACHALGFLLDRILFPGFRRVTVKAPVFVVGPPRCGTTFLHRLIAKDTHQFTSFSLGELIFAPSITERKIFALLGWVDARLGHPGRKGLDALEARLFKGFNSLHHVSFFEPEEDFVLFAYQFAFPIFLAVFPYPDLYGHLWRFDRETPPEQRTRLFNFYHSCVQRHLYFHGTNKTFLSKNPYFTPMLSSLQDRFPDACFAAVVRHPHEAVPSALAFWDMLYGFFRNDPKHYLARGFVLDFMRDFYLYTEESLAVMPEERALLLDFRGLTEDPLRAISSLHERFGIEFSSEHQGAIEEEHALAHRHRSDEQYDFESFDYSRQDLDECFEHVIVRYGLAPTE